MSEIKCPFCNSTQVSAAKKGFGLGKAAVGAFLVGGVGLLAGAIGKNKVIVTCLNCGKTWEAGDYKTDFDSPSLPTEAERRAKEAEYKAKIELAKNEIELQKINNELFEIQCMEKNKKDREEYLKNGKYLAATLAAFSEAFIKLNCAIKQYHFDKNALLVSFDEIIGKELSEAITHILELDKTSSCYVELKQTTVDIVSIDGFNGIAKLSERIVKIVPPIEENMHPKVLHFKCMKCGQTYDGDQSNVGQTIDCVSCGEKIELIAYDFLNK